MNTILKPNYMKTSKLLLLPVLLSAVIVCASASRDGGKEIEKLHDSAGVITEFSKMKENLPTQLMEQYKGIVVIPSMDDYEARIVCLLGLVDQQSLNVLVDFLLRCDAENAREITLYVSCQGGDIIQSLKVLDGAVDLRTIRTFGKKIVFLADSCDSGAW